MIGLVWYPILGICMKTGELQSRSNGWAGALTRIIQEMRCGERHRSHDFGARDSVWAWRVDECADELSAVLASQGPQELDQDLICEWLEQGCRFNTDAESSCMCVVHKLGRTALRLGQDNHRLDVELSQAKAGGVPPRPTWQHETIRTLAARSQGGADGFQAGWHAALTRISEGDTVEQLRELVPAPPPGVGAPPPQE